MPGSLETYRGFYDETPELPTKTAGALEAINPMAELNALSRELDEMFKNSSPLSEQMYLLLKVALDQVTNLKNDLMENKAAALLLEMFGIAQPGVKEDGEMDKTITQKILNVRSGLVENVASSYDIAQKRIEEFSFLLATIQKSILALIEKQYQESLTLFEDEKDSEQLVGDHLKSTQISAAQNEGVIFKSTTKSFKAQKERGSKRQTKMIALKQRIQAMKLMIKTIFTTEQANTQELSGAMAAA